MLRMIAGTPPNQLLMVGLSFGNLDELRSKPNDSYIRMAAADTMLDIDVVLCSGASFRAIGTERPSGKAVFMISFSDEELNVLRSFPGKSIIRIKRDAYRIPMDILIFSGTSETEMQTQFAELITAETKVSISPRLKN